MPMDILLVDDDPIVREVLGQQLRLQGHAVITAATTAEACFAAAARRFDAMLIDQRLDGEAGSALLQRLRELEGTRETRAIAISAELDEVRSAELQAAGFVDALEKPFDLARLNAALAIEDTVSALDDAAALAIWGNMDTVRTLRGMLRDELPVYRGMLAAAQVTRDEAALRDALHRMKSSAGFCGARPLTRFIDATPREQPDWEQLLARYDLACAALSPDLPPSTAT